MIGLYDSKFSLAIRSNINAEINNKMWARLPANLIVDMISCKISFWITMIMQKYIHASQLTSAVNEDNIFEKYFSTISVTVLNSLAVNKIIKEFSSKYDKFSLCMALSMLQATIVSLAYIIEMKLRKPKEAINYKELATCFPQLAVHLLVQSALINSVNHLNYESPKYAICKNILHVVLMH